MSGKQGNQSEGQSKNMLPSADEHNSTRRAKKAARRTHTKSMGLNTGNLFDELVEERRQAAAEERQQRELEQYEFRCDQALKARDHEWFLQLKPGTAAHRFAVAMLDAFPLADPPTEWEGERRPSRTDLAAADALDKMSVKDIEAEAAAKGRDAKKGGALSHGRRVASMALKWAYDVLTGKITEETAPSEQSTEAAPAVPAPKPAPVGESIPDAPAPVEPELVSSETNA